jgi:nucleoside-diphosphate-sugar epimerase
MRLSLGNVREMGELELRSLMEGCEGFVFAAGVDERVEGPPPIYDFYHRRNIEPLRRLLGIAKSCGARRAVVLGSYFAHFDRLRPDWGLARLHPYVRSRVDQESAALAFAEDGSMDVAVLEIPYVFGTQGGRRPVWMFLAEYLRRSGPVVLYPGGGTAAVTVRQVGQAIAGALERSRGGARYPIGFRDMSWTEMLSVMLRGLGMGSRPVVRIPAWAFAAFGAIVDASRRARGIEGGLRMARFARVMASETFVDGAIAARELGVEPDDVEAAIEESMRLCADIMDGRASAIGMSG